MSLSIGIVGLPNVGKSTLFNALTEKSVPSENYPFCTIDPSVGVVGVPDERLLKLTELSSSAKTIPAAVEFTDIAGLVKGASEGEGLGNKFLANIREVDAIAHVARIFDDEDVIHVHGKVDPLGDIGIINLELIMADAATVANRIVKSAKDAKRDKNIAKEHDLLIRIEKALSEGNLASSVDLSEEEQDIMKSLHLLTSKPMMYVLNKKAGAENLDELEDERWKSLMEYFKSQSSMFTIVDASTEGDMQGMSQEEKGEFRSEMGDMYGGLDTLITKGYELLGLMTFFTTGETETRAWTTKIGSTAPESGRALHSDFHDKFIKADIINWEKLLEAGSYAVAREQGSIALCGKDYIVQDGDVIEFKI